MWPHHSVVAASHSRTARPVGLSPVTNQPNLEVSICQSTTPSTRKRGHFEKPLVFACHNGNERKLNHLRLLTHFHNSDIRSYTLVMNLINCPACMGIKTWRKARWRMCLFSSRSYATCWFYLYAKHGALAKKKVEVTLTYAVTPATVKHPLCTLLGVVRKVRTV